MFVKVSIRHGEGVTHRLGAGWSDRGTLNRNDRHWSNRPTHAGGVLTRQIEITCSQQCNALPERFWTRFGIRFRAQVRRIAANGARLSQATDHNPNGRLEMQHFPGFTLFSDRFQSM